jgi:Na+/H+ antiporter NhaC
MQYLEMDVFYMPAFLFLFLFFINITTTTTTTTIIITPPPPGRLCDEMDRVTQWQ